MTIDSQHITSHGRAPETNRITYEHFFLEGRTLVWHKPFLSLQEELIIFVYYMKQRITAMDNPLKWENDYIINSITNLINSEARFVGLSEEDINTILDSEKWAERFHGKFILDAIFTFLEAEGCLCSRMICDRYLGTSFWGEPKVLPLSEIKNIPSICEESHIGFLNSQYVYRNSEVVKNISKKNLVDKGAVYTQLGIVRSIVENTLKNLSPGLSSNLRVLDFATGTGRFYTEIVEYLSERFTITPEQVVLNNVYAIDLDPIALNITRLKAFSYLHSLRECNLECICDRIALKNGLIRQGASIKDNSLAISPDDFNGLFDMGFDAVVSNPPYLVLKPNKKLAPAAWTELQEQIRYFRNSGLYTYSIEGMLNLYQLSIESMLMMLKPGGELGVICPSTLFADLSATKLRKHLLRDNQVRSIRYYAEKDDLFVNVSQATCIFYLKKGEKTTMIDIDDGKRHFKVDYNLICELFPEKMEIPNISSIEWGILRKLKAFPKLKNVKEIRCKRGELDLSIMKDYITRVKTPYRLVRGNMISADGIKNENGEYVDPSFFQTKTSDYISMDFGRERLVCQQISNTSLQRRLVFCFCCTNDVLGNSCNYVSAEPAVLAKMRILLNSPLLNWRFKITSSNNHINNYELDELPIVSLESVSLEESFDSRVALSKYVCKLYGLNNKEQDFIRQYENL